MTFKILTDDTHKVIYRSLVRSALDPNAPNLRADLLASADGETKPPKDPVIKSHHDDGDGDEVTRSYQMPIVDPAELIGRTFLVDKDDGNRHRARIVEAIRDHSTKVKENVLKFKVSMNNDAYEELLTYHEVMDHIAKEEGQEILWKFKQIVAHEGPLHSNHPNYKGSKFNIMIEWENGEKTTEPLDIIAADDPVTCAIYARDHNLLDEPGWKRFRSIAKRQKKMFRMANQAKLRSFRTAPKYKYGFEVPRDYAHAMRLDEQNGNKRWAEATELEMVLMQDYKVFKDLGLNAPIPEGYKNIRVHLVYDVKHDGRHRARLVADGHLTDIPVDSVYSGVVSLRGFRLLVLLGELNGLEIWGTDISSAYLEAHTKEKVCIKAGPEFGPLEGLRLLVDKALYGLRSSGLRWHQKFSDILRSEGFKPCLAEPDIWMRPAGDCYEYVAVYVDDIAMALKNPAEFVDQLSSKYDLKFKGTGPISFHLGSDFIRDENGVLCMMPKKFIEKVISSYERMFGEKPSTKYHSPMEKGDHPELDQSELLDQQGIQQFQSLIGSLQWAVSIGRFDIATAVMSLSSFRAAPRRGHLERAKRICGYLRNLNNAMIRFRTSEPDYSDLPDPVYDWDTSVYGEISEILPEDAPKPLGKPVILTHFVDANLYHDMLTGRSVTGIIHMINQTPIDWFSKKQATVETATYGSEFVAARTCVEQIIDLRSTLRYLGVPIHEKSRMFGDNKSVVDSATRIDAKLHKRHTALSFHRVREAIASGFVGFYHIKGSTNPADILSKHWAYSDVWKLLRPLLFWQGDTSNIED